MTVRRFLAAFCTVLVELSAAAPAGAAEKRECVAAHEQAQRLRLESKLLESQKKLVECAQEACPAIVRTDCAQWLSEVQGRIPSVVVEARDGNNQDLTAVRVIYDGVPLVSRLDGEALPVDPGIHHFRFEADGAAPVEQDAVIREGEHDRRLLVVFSGAASPALPPRSEEPAPRTPAALPPAAYVTGTVAVIALGSFAYFGIKGKFVDLPDLDSCKGHCSDDQVAPVRRELLAADISLGTALIFGGITTWLVLAHRGSTPGNPTGTVSRARQTPADWSWSFHVGPHGGVAFDWATRF